MKPTMERITNQSAESKSLDITDANIEQLRQIFPEVFSEGKVDFEALKDALGGSINDTEESYQLSWNGKNKTRQITRTVSNGTLRPCKEESVNWESTENLFIEGDNLEVLKLLQKSYHKTVKMIYIDPPYNTGGDFVYEDNFKDNIKHYLEITSQVDSAGNQLSTNSESSGRFHSSWLNMMYSRLKLAKNLIKNDGCIVIHLDEHENYHLRIMLNEIFGEDNFLGEICWDKGNPKGDSTKIAYQHESILIFAKNIEVFKEKNTIIRPKENAEKMISKAKQLFSKLGSSSVPTDLKKLNSRYNLSLDLNKYSKVYSLEDIQSEFKEWVSKQNYLSGGEAAYNKIDVNGNVYRTVSMAWPNKKKAPDDYFIPLIHPITKKACPVPDRGWRNPPETMAKLEKEGLIVYGEDETKQPEKKYLLKENMYENVPSILKFAGSDDALLKKLEVDFDNPKPVGFAKKLISYFTEKNDVILDFFAGSGTTGHACLNFGLEDERKFILVQLPEPTSTKSMARKNGFKFISEITKFRLKKVCQDSNAGFKVLKLDETNIKPWDADFDDPKGVFLNSIESIKDGREDDDVLYEVLLKYGIELTTYIEEELIEGKKVYVIGAGALVVCLDDEITTSLVESICKLEQVEDSETTQVVFKDAGFADSTIKTNAVQILKQAGIEDVKSL